MLQAQAEPAHAGSVGPLPVGNAWRMFPSWTRPVSSSWCLQLFRLGSLRSWDQGGTCCVVCDSMSQLENCGNSICQSAGASCSLQHWFNGQGTGCQIIPRCLGGGHIAVKTRGGVRELLLHRPASLGDQGWKTLRVGAGGH